MTMAELVMRAREGDGESFTELVRRTQKAVYGAAYAGLLDRDGALDVAQDAFLHAYRNLDDLREPNAFPGWVVGISRRLAARRRRDTDACGPLDEGIPEGDDLAARVAERDMVERALACLPAEGREALCLSLVDGYSYEEVAAMTGTTPASVRGRIHRARRRMREEMQTMLEQELASAAPGEEFTEETVRGILAQSWESLRSHDPVRTRELAEQAIAMADSLSDGDLRAEARWALAMGIQWRDRPHWACLMREVIAIREEAGDPRKLADALYYSTHNNGVDSEEEQQARLDRALAIWRGLGDGASIGWALFFHGWHLIGRGEAERAWATLAEARSAQTEGAPPALLACLDASDAVRELAGSAPADRWHASRATCSVVSAQDGWIEQADEPGAGRSATGNEAPRTDAQASGFSPLLWWLGRLPLQRPEDEARRTLDTFSLTDRRTHTETWLEDGEGDVVTPAGTWRDLFVVRARVSAAPGDEEPNARRTGDYTLWLARGIGPVAMRHERGDGVVDHVLLDRVVLPEHDDRWIPLAVGTRWEWVPAEPHPDFPTRSVAFVTAHDDEGKVYIAQAALRVRVGESE